MKKEFIVILLAQTILILVCLVYAMVQKTDATRFQKEAHMNLILANANATEAMKQNEMAKKQAEIAISLKAELDLCRKK